MKKLSRILFVLCLLTALLCIVSTTAFAQEALQNIEVFVPELVEGEAFPAPYVDEAAGYTISSYKWRWVNGSVITNPGDVVEVKRYRIEMSIAPKEGYEIDRDAVIAINGEQISKSFDYYGNGVIMSAKGTAEIRAGFTLRTKLQRAEITLSPEAGTAVNQTPIISSEPDKYTVRIRDVSVPGGYTYTGSYEDGTRYELGIYVTATDAYEFAEGSVLVINGEEVSPASQSWNVFHIRYVVDLDRTVAAVEFPAYPETVAPGAGGVTELPVPEGANYTLQQGWLDLRTGALVDTLTAGDVYTMAYVAEPTFGYFFREDTVFTQNGEDCEAMGGDKYRVMYKTYDLGAQKIDRVDVTLPTLYKGCTPGKATVPADANYSLAEVLWAESTTGSHEDAQLVDVLSFHTSIYAVSMLVADEGYTFSEDVKLYFNGVEAQIKDLYLEGPMAEMMGLYGTLTPPEKDGWIQEDNTWAYYVGGVKKTNSWMKDSKGWCYLGAEGLMLKEDWAKDSKGWCYLDKNGYMVYDKWVQWNGSWYCINKNGYMLSNTWKKDYKDWCYLGADGRMYVNKWQKDSKGWCYLGADGYMVRNGWAADTAGICWLDSNGYIAYSKWIQDTDGWRYVNSKGYMVYNDWAKIGGYWYAFDGYGVMFSDTLVQYNNKYYYMDKNGRMLTSTWFKLNGYWSYVNADGYIPLNTWVRDSKGWCYINAGGYMLTDGWVKENGKSYYLDSNGYMLTNTTRWIKGEMGLSLQYRFDSNGVASRIW